MKAIINFKKLLLSGEAKTTFQLVNCRLFFKHVIRLLIAWPVNLVIIEHNYRPFRLMTSLFMAVLQHLYDLADVQSGIFQQYHHVKQ